MKKLWDSQRIRSMNSRISLSQMKLFEGIIRELEVRIKEYKLSQMKTLRELLIFSSPAFHSLQTHNGQGA